MPLCIFESYVLEVLVGTGHSDIAIYYQTHLFEKISAYSLV